MATNNFNLTNGADLVLSDGANSYGFKYMKGTGMTESRGAAFAPSVANSETTFADAEPFKRWVQRDPTGGMGQLRANKQIGGYGQGGDPTKFMNSNAYTLQPPVIMPGIARLPQVTGSTTTDNTSPVPMTRELPRGVVPMSNPQGLIAEFTCLNTNSIASFDVLMYTADSGLNSNDVGVVMTIKDLNNPAYTKVLTTNQSNPNSGPLYQLPGFKWCNFQFERTGTSPSYSWSAITPFSLVAGHVYRVTFTGGSENTTDNLRLILGGSVTTGTSGDMQMPYLRARKAANNKPFTYMPDRPVAFVRAGDNTSSIKVGVYNNGIFNADDPNWKANTLGSSPDNRDALYFKNTLYVYGGSGTNVYTISSLSNLTAGTVTPSITSLRGATSMVVIDGLIYASYLNSLYKWDGTGTAANQTFIANQGFLGDQNYDINRIFLYNGLLYAIKPEGLYVILDNPSRISTAQAPLSQQLIDHGDLTDRRNGMHMVLHKGVVYYNVGNLIYAVTISNTQGVQVTPIAPQMALSNQNNRCRVTGLASDGVNLYVTYTNIGIMAYNDRGWHLISEFYEIVDDTDLSTAAAHFVWNSGLRLFQDGQKTYLYCADEDALIRQQVQTVMQPFSSNIKAWEQNCCFYHVTSIWDGDLAEIIKFLRSVVMFTYPNGWNFKVVCSLWRSGDASAARAVQRALKQGLSMNSLNSDLSSLSNANSLVVSNSTTFQSSDFANQYAMAEKPATTDEVGNPFSLVSCAFIIYGWDKSATHFTDSTEDPVMLDATVIKFLPIQDYVPSYACTLDVQALVDVMAQREPYASADADIAWLRGRFGAHGPTQAQFKGPDGQTKTVNVFFTKDPMRFGGMDPVANQGNTATYTIQLQMISTTEEYKVA